MQRNSSLMFSLLAGLLPAFSVRAQLVTDFKPPKAECCLQFAAQRSRSASCGGDYSGGD